MLHTVCNFNLFNYLKRPTNTGIDLPVRVDIAGGRFFKICISPAVVGKGCIAANAPGQPGI